MLARMGAEIFCPTKAAHCAAQEASPSCMDRLWKICTSGDAPTCNTSSKVGIILLWPYIMHSPCSAQALGYAHTFRP